MSIDLTGKVYKDMSKQYRDAVSREDFKKERRSQNRMAGDALKSDYFPDGAPIMDPEEDNIYSYDTSAFGAGSSRDTERLSRADLKNLENQGYSIADIVDYAENIGETGVITDGAKAQKLLDRYKRKLARNEEGDTNPVDPVDPDPVDPVIPDDDNETGIEDPFPVIQPITQTIENTSGTMPGIEFIPEMNVGGNFDVQSVYQDNDINSNVAGNNNTTTISQDNSVMQYGGNGYGFKRIPSYY
jgi:hypothetical protein|tara:strand:- start:297 stop:1025 length:729 start_codon:yes stop_codon:yes gene_type:complete